MLHLKFRRMEKKYKIHVNPKRLTSIQIARHKNFEALLAQLQPGPKRRPALRRLMYAVSAAAAVLVGLVIFAQVTGRPSFEEKQKTWFARQPFVQPPVVGVEPQFISFRVSADTGGVLECPGGSRIIVPPLAFMDENSNAISGEVILYYREMHDFVDFFLRGIPMQYDSAGLAYTLESAGMVEVFAEQNGKRININSGREISFELISRLNVSPFLAPPATCNIYQLDEQERNWTFKGLNHMEALKEEISTRELDKNSPFYPAQSEFRQKMQAIELQEASEIARIEAEIPSPKQPLKPQKAGTEDYVFDLDLNELKKPEANRQAGTTQQELKELYRQYEKMLWRLNPRSGVSAEHLQREFSQVTGLNIRKLNEQDYELTLEKDSESLTVIVNPVLTGSSYEKALAGFNRDFELWQKQIADREKQLKARKETLLQKIQEEKRLARMIFEEKIADLKAKGLDYAASDDSVRQKVINRFSASGFGIWNLDQPLLPEVSQLAANFQDQWGNKLKNTTAYLVDNSKNTYYRFFADDPTILRFDKDAQNLLWMVTPNNKIAVFRPEDFKKIPADAKKFNFVLREIDKKVTDEKSLREILYL